MGISLENLTSVKTDAEDLLQTTTLSSLSSDMQEKRETDQDIQ